VPRCVSSPSRDHPGIAGRRRRSGGAPTREARPGPIAPGPTLRHPPDAPRTGGALGLPRGAGVISARLSHARPTHAARASSPELRPRRQTSGKRSDGCRRGYGQGAWCHDEPRVGLAITRVPGSEGMQARARCRPAGLSWSARPRGGVAAPSLCAACSPARARVPRGTSRCRASEQATPRDRGSEQNPGEPGFRRVCASGGQAEVPADPG
jgi:hypothetical protein